MWTQENRSPGIMVNKIENYFKIELRKCHYMRKQYNGFFLPVKCGSCIYVRS